MTSAKKRSAAFLSPDKPQATAASDERVKLLVSQREVLQDAELAAAGKALKKDTGSGAAALPERVAGGVGVAGAGSQSRLDQPAKQSDAKAAGEKSELLARRSDDLALAPVATKAKEFADRDAGRMKDVAKMKGEAVVAAPISAPSAALQPTAPQPTAPPAPSVSSGVAGGSVTASAPAGPAAAKARPLPVVTPSAPGVTTASLFRQESLSAAAVPGGAGQGVAQQNFVRLNAPDNYRRNLQSPPSPALLQQFQIQRTGNEVTVVDEDGSVYQGQVIAAEAAVDRANRRLPEMPRKSDPAAAADKAGEKNAGQPVSQTAAGGTDTNSFWFRASGTNRSLNQRIVFTGEFQSGAGEVGAPAADEPAKRSALRSMVIVTNSQSYGFQRAVGTDAAQGAGRIQGRARVGANSEIQVEAVSSGSLRR